MSAVNTVSTAALSMPRTRVRIAQVRNFANVSWRRSYRHEGPAPVGRTREWAGGNSRDSSIPSFVATAANFVPPLPFIAKALLLSKCSFLVIRFCMMWQNEKIMDSKLDFQNPPHTSYSMSLGKSLSPFDYLFSHL